MAQFLQHLMDQYGYYVLAASLMLELLALPLPNEVLMTYAGLMVFEGHLNWTLSILAAGLGASIGMTISYGIGSKLGTPFFEKHGSKFHLGPDKLKKTSQWFGRYGNKLLIIAFFIPGVRHFTGYFSGVTRMPLRSYMIYVYTGAFLWTGTFISLGKILGPKWEQFHHTITKYLIIAGIAAALIFVIVYMIRKYRSQIYHAAAMGLNKGVKTFHSLGRIKLLVLISFGVFLLLFIEMASLIQDFLSNEFTEFDAFTSYMIHSLFNKNWAARMNRFAALPSSHVLLTIAGLTFIWVCLKGKNRMLETGFLIVVCLGGELLDEGLRRLFHRPGPDNLMDTFPSEQALTIIVFFGFSAFLFVRHLNITWVKTGVFFLVLAVSLLVGVSNIYLDTQYPSDVMAGYVFGGVWLSLNIGLLEIYRFIRNNRMNFLA